MLKKGTVTQNRYYVSYKTKSYHSELGYLKSLANELKEFLLSKKVTTDVDNYEVLVALMSQSRQSCITIRAVIPEDARSSGILDTLPFVSDSIN